MQVFTKIIIVALSISLGAEFAFAQDPVPPEWEVSIPGPIADGTPAEPVEQPALIPFKVLTSQTKRVYVTEASELQDLPPVEGVINVTVQKVEDPGLPDLPLPPPPAAQSLNNPADVLGREDVSEEDQEDSRLVFVSASVYDHSRTLVTISPYGTSDGKIAAWSNVDFNHFSAFCSFRVTKADGTEHDRSLMMGLGNEETVLEDTEQPEIPSLPDVSVGGPSFSVIEGDTQGEGMKLLTELHDLYRKEGARLEAAFHAREKAYAERRAFLIANPPKPKDLVIRFWRGDRTENAERTP
jgi:hypothetical protein